MLQQFQQTGKPMKTILFSFAFILLLSECFSRSEPAGDTDSQDSLYLGQVPPGDSAILFAPGYISIPNRRETKIVFSPNNMECLIGIGKNNAFQVLYTDFYSGSWKVPEPAAFQLPPMCIEPFFSADSLHVFLTSNVSIFRSERVKQSWTTPVKVGPPVSTVYDEYHPTTTRNGTLYFCSNRENGAFAIYRCTVDNGTYEAAEKLPLVINRSNAGQDGAYDPFIAPDESYLVFSCIRAGGYGKADQYISYNRNGRWTNPKNLGPSINTAAIEYGSYVSPDGKYYFFSRPAGWGPNAAADIYWIRIDSLISNLKFTNFAPYLENPIPDQADTVGHSFNFMIPDSTFFDDDGNNTLNYSATLADGSPLPEWLGFDTVSATFSGIPVSIGTLKIRVTASDPTRASDSAQFSLEIVRSNSTGCSGRHDIRIFPNPTIGPVTISLGSFPAKKARLEIENPEGRTILNDTFSKETGINLTGKPRGIYLINVTLEHRRLSGKICLE
jgi:hypothetical protein